MLKPLIVGACSVTLIDSLLVAVAFVAASFAFDINVEGPASAHIEPLEGAALWHYWVQAAAGAAFALLLRLLWRRRTRLAPLSLATLIDDAVGAASYTLYFLALFFYRVRLRDPAHALTAPFAVGVLQSMAGLLVAMLVCMVVLAYAAPERATPLWFGSHAHLTAAYVGCAMALLDLVAFERGYWIALMVAAFVAVALGLGALGPRQPSSVKHH